LAESNALVLDFEGAVLRVSASNARWTQMLADGCHWFLSGASDARGFSLSIEEDERPRVPEAFPHTWSGRLIEGTAANLYETEDTWTVELPGYGHATINYAEKQASIIARPGGFDAFMYTPLSAIVEATLSTQGQRVLHAACLGVPNTPGSILLCAPSGFGKTTTSLALAHGGFIFMADDTSAVLKDDGHWKVWGIPNRIKVHRRTAELLPWIGDLPDNWNAEDEQGVHIDDLRHAFQVRKHPPRPVHAVVMLGERTDDSHQINPVSRAEALLQIAQDNVSNSPTGVKPWSQSQFSVYADLVRSNPVLQLRVGSDLTTLAPMLEQALARLSGTDEGQ
tara:strand:- start:25727 stop:26737 length:1011 start_codon:yes stop_codon:yes gene_type:complete